MMIRYRWYWATKVWETLQINRWSKSCCR